MSNQPQHPVPASAQPVVQASPPPPPPTLKDLLWDRYSTLLGIKRRVYFLRAFVADLDRVARGKTFRIRNDIVWNMILDARDKCVIDLYSLTVGMRHGVKPEPNNPKVKGGKDFMKKKGLFFYLRNHHRAKLSRTYVADPSDDTDEIRVHTATKSARFDRLFPACTT